MGKAQLRILLITPILDPCLLWAGSHRVVYEIGKFLVKRGHRVVVLTSDMLNIRTKIEQSVYKTDLHNCVKIVRARTLSCKLTEMTSMTISIDTLNFLKRELPNFDVVHAHEYTTFENIILNYYATKHNIPYVLHAHGSLPRIGKASIKWFYDQVFGYRILRDASKVIALTEVEARQYEKMGVPRGKIAIIPNGIDLEEYRELPPKGCFKKKFGIDEDKKIILYLGRIHKIKGIDILIKGFAKVVEMLENARLAVVGPDDGYLGEIEALVKALKIEDKTLILGPLFGKDKLEAFVDADVYVLPSRYETSPMTVLEAVACGTPVVLTEKCGIAEYFRDKVGLVVKPEPKHIAEALLEMLLNLDKQNTFRENCKTVTERFNISKTISKLEEVYEEIVN